MTIYSDRPFFELYRLSFHDELVGALAIDPYSRVGWGYLLDIPEKMSGDDFLDFFLAWENCVVIYGCLCGEVM